jgi:hypothetical protein
VPQNNHCSLCGAEQATGWAFINSERFCHGDSILPSCYEETCWAMETGYLGGDWLDDDPLESMKKRKEEYK